MRLTDQEIQDILASKKLSCSNLTDYQNMDTILHLTCEQGHQIEASIRTVRNPNFKCYACEGKASISHNTSTNQPPAKTGYRVVALDNATENAGVSVFDNGQLVYWTLFTFKGETLDRIAQNRQMIENTIIRDWQANLLVLEDIQLQQNVVVFKTLAMLLGNALISARLAKVKTETVLSKVWRSHFMIGGKTRIQQKAQAIEKVRTMYDITVTDDVAEAILLGKYAADCLRTLEVKKLF